jgi:glutamate-1-semialdehyde 2,1-aminomutase
MALQKYLELFESRTKKSRAIWEEARKYLPGGVAGQSAFLAPHPIYVDKAVGGRLVDVDGNIYIDLLLGAFPNILGHSPAPVVKAVKEQLKRGTSYMLFQETGIS